MLTIEITQINGAHTHVDLVVGADPLVQKSRNFGVVHFTRGTEEPCGSSVQLLKYYSEKNELEVKLLIRIRLKIVQLDWIGNGKLKKPRHLARTTTLFVRMSIRLPTVHTKKSPKLFITPEFRTTENGHGTVDKTSLRECFNTRRSFRSWRSNKLKQSIT